MRTKLTWAGAAAVGVLGAVLGWLHFGPRERGALGPGGYALHYAFEMDLAEAGGKASHVMAVVDGTLDVVDRGEGERVARLNPTRLTLNDDAQRAGFNRAAAEAGLATPFFLSVAPDGRVSGVRLNPSLPLAVRSVLTTVAQGTQYVAGPRDGPDEWATSETDMNGSYRAVYRHAARAEVHKTYVLGQKDQLGSVRGRANVNYTLQGGRVVTVAMDQKGEALTGSSTGPRSPFTVRVSLTRTGEADTSWVDAATKDAEVAQTFTTETGVPRNLRISGPAPRPTEKLLEALDAAEPKGSLATHTQLRNELTDAVARDAALAAALEKTVLRNATSPVLQRRLAVEAMLGARTEHSDLRAAELITDKTVPMDVRIMFLGGATVLQNPGAPVVQAVRALMKSGQSPIFGQAAMALGGILSTHVQDGKLMPKKGATNATGSTGGVTLGGPQLSPVVGAADGIGFVRVPPPGGASSSSTSASVDAGHGADAAVGTPDAGPAPVDHNAEMAAELLGIAQHVLSPEPNAPRVPFGLKASFIRALGNLGTVECLPLVRVGLVDDNLLVRAAAANALRFLPPALVKQDLARAMRDPAMEVRGAALKAARKMGPAATLDLAQTALMFDKSENVRLQAVYTFGAWSHEAPAMLTKLTEAAEHEKSPKVQQAIRHMTQKNRVEPPFVMDPLPGSEP